MVGGAAKDVGWFWDTTGTNVFKEALEVCLSIGVQIKLEASYLGNVLLLSEKPPGVDWIHAEIDVIRVGVKVSEPSLIFDCGGFGGSGEALLNVAAFAGNGQDGNVVVVVVEPLEVASGDSGDGLEWQIWLI